MPPHDLQDLLHTWGRLWGVPDLPHRVTVRFSPRLRRSLGRCNPATGALSLHPDLQDHPSLPEVLCHEAAHVAARRLHGPAARPHGPEWAALVRQAGYTPATRLALGAPAPALRGNALYIHRCPVCHMERTARRPVPGWRCRACVTFGLDGRLVIERIR